MTVKNKLIISYIMIIFLIILLTASAFSTLNNINKSFHTMTQVNVPQRYTISQAVLAMEKTISNLKTYVMSYNDSEIYVQTIYESLDILKKHLIKLKNGEKLDQTETITEKLKDEDLQKIEIILKRLDKLKTVIHECISIHSLKVDLHFELYSKIYDIEKYFYRLNDKNFDMNFNEWYKNNKVKNKKIKTYIEEFAKAHQNVDKKLQKEYSDKIIKTSARTLDMIKESRRVNFKILVEDATFIAKELHVIEESIIQDYHNSQEKIISIFSHSLQTNIVIVFFIILISLVIAVSVSKNIIHSLSSFEKGLLHFFKFINNETTTIEPIKLYTNDEFGKMAVILNENIKNSSKLHRELVELKNNLEMKVQERTEALKQANYQLIELNNDLEQQVQEGIAKNIKHELQLFQQSKMASMGAMIGNIAHQWRQPLSVISMTANNIMVDVELDSLDTKMLIGELQQIILEIEYLNQNISTFRNFLKEKKDKRVVVLQERIDLALKISNITLKDNHIELKNKIEYGELIEVELVVGELVEVLINIINNAKDILLEKKISKPWVEIDLYKKDQRAVITIEDNGGGVPDEILPKIFEEYFTTKDEEMGTGLGLHMSYEIIEKSLDGKLYVENTQNGAKFFIELPLAL